MIEANVNSDMECIELLLYGIVSAKPMSHYSSGHTKDRFDWFWAQPILVPRTSCQHGQGERTKFDRLVDLNVRGAQRRVYSDLRIYRN